MDNNIIKNRTKGEWELKTFVDGKKLTTPIFKNDEIDPFITILHNEYLWTETQANAAFIVKAVNNFEPMLAELKRLYEKHGGLYTQGIIKKAEK